ncbi:hypothetical protein LCGC14_2569130, partial [marine sediment metagenome]
SDAGYIGTRLTDDHPISFTYDAALATKNRKLHRPSTLAAQLPLDPQGQLQCTTCHDPHNGSRGHFLRMSNLNSRMCTRCHDHRGWAASAHATASASVTGAARDNWGNVPYRTVSELGCEGCHRPHNARGRERLMRHEVEEDNCFSCHDGSVAAKNIMSEFGKRWAHPVGKSTGVHNPAEDPRTMQDHVECSDCHNPHQVAGSGRNASAPFIGPAMKGVSGLSSSGVPIAEATRQYEVCYKCHAKRNPVREPLVDRHVRNNNIADKFSLSSVSFHPVEGYAQGTSVPSLLEPLKHTSIIYCTDCHGSNSARVKGPHGSTYRPLLVRNYSIANPTSTRESPQAYALCYGCHNRRSILRNAGFKEHKKHLDKKISCSACHDPHGVQSTTHLINFDREVVFASKTAGKGPIFEDRGFRRGSCTLLCHGEDHDDQDYRP